MIQAAPKERRNVSAVSMKSQWGALPLISLAAHGRGRTRFAPPCRLDTAECRRGLQSEEGVSMDFEIRSTVFLLG